MCEAICRRRQTPHGSPSPSFSKSRSRSFDYISLPRSPVPDLNRTDDSLDSERSVSQKSNSENSGRRRPRYIDYNEEEEEEEDERSVSDESARVYDSDSLRYKRSRKQDLISELPDSIILHILSCLPATDAVKTGVLSKRWTYLWRKVSSLNFSWDSLLYHYNTKRFVEFVHTTLFFYTQSSITKFSAKFQYDDLYSSDVDRWIRLISLLKAKEIILNFNLRRDLEMNTVVDYYKLPQHFFANQSLTKLELCNCSVERLEKISWNSLKSLSIGCTFLVDNGMNVILDGSPLLEFLELHGICGLQNLRISNEKLRKLVIRNPWDGYNEEEDVIEIFAPNLQSLTISGKIHKKKFKLLDVRSLTDCCLDYDGDLSSADESNYYKTQRDMLKDLLQDLRHVKTINLGPWCIQILSVLEVQQINSSLSNRKCLILNTPLERWVFHGVANLLKSSNCLKTLVINIKDHYLRQLRCIDELIPEEDIDYWKSQKSKFVGSMLHLKTLKINGVRPECWGCDEIILPFLQYILEDADILGKMIIKDDGPTINPSLEMAKKLLGFPRSSPKAVVTFLT